MRFDVISRDMLRPMYEQALNRKEQISILAQLTDSSEEEVCQALGLPVRAGAGAKKTYDEDAAYQLWLRGLSDTEIAKRLKITRETVGAWRKRCGLERNRRGWKPLDQEACAALYREGLTDEIIAKRLEVSKSSVAKWRQKNALPPNGKKEVFDAEKARRLYEKGATDKEIGKAIGYHAGSIQAWRTRNGLPAQCRRRKG